MLRRRVPELMDRVDADERELARSLADLRRVNRWLGGRRGALRLMMAMVRRIPTRPVRILDVGTGGADIPLALAKRARGTKEAIKITGVDLHPTTIGLARSFTASDPDVVIEAGDALALPFVDRQFDLVMSHTTLHHFDPGEAERAIAEMDRVARWGVVVTDLARSRAALVGAHALAASAWRTHPITRHDGPHSVRAAFTPAELAGIAARATQSPFRVRREPVFRLSLVIDKLPGAAASEGRHGKG